MRCLASTSATSVRKSWRSATLSKIGHRRFPRVWTWKNPRGRRERENPTHPARATERTSARGPPCSFCYPGVTLLFRTVPGTRCRHFWPLGLHLDAGHGSLGLHERAGRTRDRGRPRHREHARLRPRTRDRPLGALRRRDRPALRRGARRGHRGQAHARPHARHDLGDPAAQGRGHRRLRRDRADAPPLHPEGAPQPLRAPARRRLRPVRRHGRREARRGGSDL